MASIHDSINNIAPSINGTADINGDANGDANGAPPDGERAAGEGADGGGGGGTAAGEGSAAAAAIAAASASRVGVAGETRSAADGGGEIWVEPPVVVKKYNKVRQGGGIRGGDGGGLEA